jgi:Cu-Zn family superoxide dismutase
LIVFSLPSAAKTKVDLKDAQGKDVGTIILSQQGSGVSPQASPHDLPPGEHAIHFHQNPKCDGPISNPPARISILTARSTDSIIPKATTPATCENFTVDVKGNADVQPLEDKDVTLGDGAHSLFSNGGTAIVIHAKADDYENRSLRQLRRPHRLRRDHKVRCRLEMLMWGQPPRLSSERSEDSRPRAL